MDIKPSRIFTIESDDDVLGSPLLRMDPGSPLPEAGDMIVARFKGGAELTIFVERGQSSTLTVDARVSPWATFQFVLHRETDGLLLEWQPHHRDIIQGWLDRGMRIGGRG